MLHNKELSRAIMTIRNGGIIIYPTETVYGMGCDPFNNVACRRIYSIKGRRESKPFILLACSLEQVEEYIGKLSGNARKLAEAFWPGPLTIVIQPIKSLPEHLIGPSGGVAMRVTSYPQAKELSHEAGMPLVSTSANKTGFHPVTTYEEAQSLFINDVDFILRSDQPLCGNPSTVIDLTFHPPKILREGSISREDIKRFL